MPRRQPWELWLDQLPAANFSLSMAIDIRGSDRFAGSMPGAATARWDRIKTSRNERVGRARCAREAQGRDPRGE